MNIQIAEEMLTKIQKIEEMLLEIDANIPKISPDLKSTVATKSLMVEFLKNVFTLRYDINRYRNGSSLIPEFPSAQDILNKLKNPNDFPNFGQ